MAATAEQASPWLNGRSFAALKDEFDRSGYLIFERVLPPERVAEIRAALAPHLARDLLGRNDFEGTKTNRVYALLAKSPVFAELAIHPLAMAFAEAELGDSCPDERSVRIEQRCRRSVAVSLHVPRVVAKVGEQEPVRA